MTSKTIQNTPPHSFPSSTKFEHNSGEAYPVASNQTPAGRTRNRRVELYLPAPGQEESRNEPKVPAGGAGLTP